MYWMLCWWHWSTSCQSSVVCARLSTWLTGRPLQQCSVLVVFRVSTRSVWRQFWVTLPCQSFLASFIGYVSHVQSVRIKKFDFLIATLIFLCVFVCRKRMCKKFFRKQQSSLGGFDLKYTKEILKNTKENIGHRDFSVFTP